MYTNIVDYNFNRSNRIVIGDNEHKVYNSVKCFIGSMLFRNP